MTHSSTTCLSESELQGSVQLIEVKPGIRYSLHTLKVLLPDIETALFFGKVFELDYPAMTFLLQQLFSTDLVTALFGEGNMHSTELQDYLIELADHVPPAQRGNIVTSPDVPHGVILPEMWASAQVEVAKSIKDVAAKLAAVIGKMPGKQGKMAFESLRVMNKRRGSIGDFKAVIKHERTADNLVILDVSGSMSAETIRRIIDDVVALSYTANAHLAIVSNTCTHWEPGEYDSNQVLQASEFGGTHYETLAPLLNQDWDVVVTIADYDSSYSAKEYIAANATGSIQKVLDLSLVDRPTYLAQCVGQLAAEVQPLLIGNSSRVMRS